MLCSYKFVLFCHKVMNKNRTWHESRGNGRSDWRRTIISQCTCLRIVGDRQTDRRADGRTGESRSWIFRQKDSRHDDHTLQPPSTLRTSDTNLWPTSYLYRQHYQQCELVFLSTSIGNKTWGPRITRARTRRVSDSLYIYHPPAESALKFANTMLLYCSKMDSLIVRTNRVVN